jgi:hypothetical protein
MPSQEPDRSQEDILRINDIAVRYSSFLALRYGPAHAAVSSMHLRIATAIVDRNAWGLEDLANGCNDCAKEAFEWATSTKLPKGQAATWAALRKWGGISDAQNELVGAQRAAEVERLVLLPQHDAASMAKNIETIDTHIRDGGMLLIRTVNRKRYWVDASATRGLELSARGSGLSSLANLISARIRLFKAGQAVEAERPSAPASKVEEIRESGNGAAAADFGGEVADAENAEPLCRPAP